MIEAAERTATDFRAHIRQLSNRLQQYEQLEDSADMTIHDLQESQQVRQGQQVVALILPISLMGTIAPLSWLIILCVFGLISRMFTW